jgi:hypothetical protein
VHFTVSAEIVVTLEEFSERLGSHAYGLVVAEYPGPSRANTPIGTGKVLILVINLVVVAYLIRELRRFPKRS